MNSCFEVVVDVIVSDLELHHQFYIYSKCRGLPHSDQTKILEDDSFANKTRFIGCKNDISFVYTIAKSKFLLLLMSKRLDLEYIEKGNFR